MKTPNKFRWAVGMVAMLASLYAQAYPGESIELDPVTGDYTLNYWNGEGLEQAFFVPATKITPAVQSRFYPVANQRTAYRYTVSSAPSSKQDIGQFFFELVSSVDGVRSNRDMPQETDADIAARMAVLDTNEAALATPAGWSGYVKFGYYDDDNSVRVSWDPAYNHAAEKSMDGIKPGKKVQGFGFASLDLPGISIVELMGNHPSRAYPDEGPLEDSAIIEQLKQIKRNDFVPRNAAVPTIAVPDPFDAAVTLERIQTHMHTWIIQQLLDPAFSSQLDRYFQSAISAYRLNQPKAGKQHIQTMRELLKKEHADADREDDSSEEGGEDKNKTKRPLIDKLAARILDFDLKYVTKRMGGGKGD